jgi:hypothetical protein
MSHHWWLPVSPFDLNPCAANGYVQNWDSTTAPPMKIRAFSVRDLGPTILENTYLFQTSIYKYLQSTISLETPCPPSVSQRLYSAIPQILLNLAKLCPARG